MSEFNIYARKLDTAFKEARSEYNTAFRALQEAQQASRDANAWKPGDSAEEKQVIQRLYNAFDTLDKKQEKYADEVQKCGDRVEIFNIADRRDKEMREIIDGLFEEPVCDSIFGSMNLYAMADGLHVWTNFLLALMDETDSAFAREQKATNPRIQKYTAKYRR